MTEAAHQAHRADHPRPADRPAFFVAAVLLHVVQAFLAIALGSLAAFGCLLAAGIVAVSAHGDDAVPAVLILGVVGLTMMTIVALGLLGLFVGYKAWRLERAWIWALLVYSILSISFQPCGVLVALITAIGSVQALERKGAGAARTSAKSAPA